MITLDFFDVVRSNVAPGDVYVNVDAYISKFALIFIVGVEMTRNDGIHRVTWIHVWDGQAHIYSENLAHDERFAFSCWRLRDVNDEGRGTRTHD